MSENASLESIPQGSVIERSYWAVPTNYDRGDEYDTKRDALAAAIEQGEKHPANQVTIDLRWLISHPEGGKTDLVASRTSYIQLAFARNALALIDRYTTT